MFNSVTPPIRLLLATVGAIYVLKAVGLAKRHRPNTRTGLLVFLFAWPVVIPDCFRDRKTPQIIDPVRFLTAWARMALGVTSIVVLAACAPSISDRVLGVAGLAGLLLTIHLGICDL